MESLAPMTNSNITKKNQFHLDINFIQRKLNVEKGILQNFGIE